MSQREDSWEDWRRERRDEWLVALVVSGVTAWEVAAAEAGMRAVCSTFSHSPVMIYQFELESWSDRIVQMYTDAIVKAESPLSRQIADADSSTPA